jgi:TrmH RNA methyltransferase
VRTAAFFGIQRVITIDSPQQARASEAAHRVAEGGMVHVEIFAVKDLAGFSRQLAASYHVIGTAVVGAQPLRKVVRQIQSGPPRPIALVFGNEESGMSREVAAACSLLVTIPGSGRVESLNVSAAAAVLCWEFCVKER